MVEEVVFDSSIILALFKGEPLTTDMSLLLTQAVMSTVGVAEVYTKLTEWKVSSTARADAMLTLLARIEPLSFHQARLAGELRTRTSHLGMGLGDRVCVALGMQLGVDVYTTDEKWTKTDFSIKIHDVRIR